MPDELSHGDLLRHPMVEAVAVQHHALQDGERALQDGHVHHRLVHIASDLRGWDGQENDGDLKRLNLVLLSQSYGLETPPRWPSKRMTFLDAGEMRHPLISGGKKKIKCTRRNKGADLGI